MSNAERSNGQLGRSFAMRALHPLVERPSRYADCELNLAGPGYVEGRFNVLLVFPDSYEIGASHQGIRFLYHRLAAMPGVGVEFAFAPWPDAERLMRATGEPLRSLATLTPARRFDLIGFSVMYELHYTNILMMLDLAGIELETARRGEEDPVVAAGGPCCTNPLPFLPAVDAVFLGDAEDSLAEAVEALARLAAAGAGRRARIEALARVDGVYVDGVSTSAKARTHRFAPGDLPRRPIVPVSEVVHQRLSIEIMRGCARGCRFCHAGMFYRPCRERTVDEIVDAVREGLDATGWDEVSLLSLSTSDYSRLGELLDRLAPELERRKVSLALPSLRPETITREIVSASGAVTRSGFTIAPEAGTERLRRVVRKDFGDAEIVEGARKILGAGWQSLKLYFMIGLPTETDEDLDGIARLVEEILALPRSRGRFNLNVSISPFVPKPHTPFQWERQCGVEEFRAKQRRLAARMPSRFVSLSQRAPEVSALEGALARGDRRLWAALRRAFELGCRFDGWVDRFRFDLWERALAEAGLSLDDLNAARPVDETLPWDALELHGTKAYLRKERDLALAEAAAERARGDSAAESGGAAGDAGTGAGAPGSPPPESRGAGARFDVRMPPPAPPAGPHFRYRFLYEKTGRARFLSHIETLNVFQRALRRSGLPLVFTEGFHPHPRISAGPSLAVGMEGFGEFLDVELASPARCGNEAIERGLPAGMRILSCAGPFTRRSGKLPSSVRFRFLVEFETVGRLLAAAAGSPPPAPSSDAMETLYGNDLMWYRLAKELAAADAHDLFERGAPVDPARAFEAMWGRMFEEGAALRTEKGAERRCRDCSVRAAGPGALELVLPGGDGGIRPQDLLTVLLPKNLAALASIRRLEIQYRSDTGWMSPMELVANA
jgi:radical SAM superfamily enzyme YgiQ (UPF0313 family)